MQGVRSQARSLNGVCVHHCCAKLYPFLYYRTACIAAHGKKCTLGRVIRIDGVKAMEKAVWTHNVQTAFFCCFNPA